MARPRIDAVQHEFMQPHFLWSTFLNTLPPYKGGLAKISEGEVLTKALVRPRILCNRGMKCDAALKF